MSTSPRSGRIRTLSASSRARREKRRAVTKRRRFLAGGVVLASLVAAPLSITALMGVGSTFPGLDAAKSLMALLEDRSPGDRTAAELTKTKTKKPEQRALGKVTKPKPPEEFIQAIAPPPPALSDLPPFPVAVAGVGPLVDIPPPPPGGGGIVTFDAPPGGGGGGGGGGGDTENPPENPPPENPPPENPPPENPPPPVVPEPATWATMLLGFGVTGLMMRRRRRTERTAQV